MSTVTVEEQLQDINIGLSTADAESVQLFYQFGDLLLRYTDWKEQECEKKFIDVLAFRWEEFTDHAPRDDCSFEIVNSAWLMAQARAREVDPCNYIHYRICFNCNGVLDVISLRC